MLFYKLPNNNLGFLNYIITLFIQGISPVTYTVDECVCIITHAERRLGREISHKEISWGALSEILLLEDYASVTQVLFIFNL